MKLTLEDAINKYVHCDGFPKYQNCERCVKRTTVIIRFIRKYPQHLDTLSITTIINLLDAMLQHHCILMFDIELCRMVFKCIIDNIKDKTMAKYFCELNKTEHFMDDNLLKSIYIIYGLQE